MRIRILLASISLSVSAYAQNRASEIFAMHKLQCDSIMRTYYGDYLFQNYFKFDRSSSTISDNNRWYFWHDSVTVDTPYTYVMSYMFDYPGSKGTYTNIYYISNAPRLKIYGESQPKPYSGRCEIQDSVRLDSLAQKQLKHPLSECTVRLVNVSNFERATRSKMDSSHVYLEVTYKKSKPRTFNRWVARIRERSIVVDGCTGQVIRKNKRRYRVHTHW